MERIEGRVVKVLDEFKVVINKGAEDGVKEGMVFYIFEYGEDIIDPFTNENLGKLEVLKGKASVEHVQDKMAILKSLPKIKRKIIKHTGKTGLLGSLYGLSELFPKEEIITDEQLVPLTDVKVGDFARSV